jgi:cytochrome b561
MLTDTRNGYGAVAILLHWFAAVAMIYLWLTGPDNHGGSAGASTASHIAIGSGLAIFLIARVLWRLASVNPTSLSANTALNTVAAIVKMLLLLDLLLIIGTGMLGVWFKGDPISLLFGAVPLPNLVGVHTDLVRPMHGLHSLSTNLIFPALLGLHVLGALKHLVWDRDGTVARMIWPRRQEA